MEEKKQVEYFDFTQEMQEEAEKIIEEDNGSLSNFIYTKFDNQANKMWDVFYKNNTANFFKDRHYLLNEFPELNGEILLLEVGCGVGNAIYPLLEDNQALRAQVCDFSREAINLLRQNPSFNSERLQADVCDITKQPVPFTEPSDALLILFVLSAISPEKHRLAIANATSNLKPGGLVMFRDYGRYDLAQLRLAGKRNKKLKENFYLKQDGTRCYYFTTQEIETLFEGFRVLENEYHYRVVKNRKEDIKMNRVWIQAKLIKL
ncbi:unnamed protein product [Blepharisma stoltei]|uniref:tRNA N(3)-methylcytidine methyltransferase n=1 Tax=Blepharisma stoltei TaxID=1481888 RepID=A0AAU9J6M9_9CILI|nr:unnamed protein product [Blepharisma stoltei]